MGDHGEDLSVTLELLDYGSSVSSALEAPHPSTGKYRPRPDGNHVEGRKSYKVWEHEGKDENKWVLYYAIPKDAVSFVPLYLIDTTDNHIGHHIDNKPVCVCPWDRDILHGDKCEFLGPISFVILCKYLIGNYIFCFWDDRDGWLRLLYR